MQRLQKKIDQRIDPGVLKQELSVEEIATSEQTGEGQ